MLIRVTGVSPAKVIYKSFFAEIVRERYRSHVPAIDVMHRNGPAVGRPGVCRATPNVRPDLDVGAVVSPERHAGNRRYTDLRPPGQRAGSQMEEPEVAVLKEGGVSAVR